MTISYRNSGLAFPFGTISCMRSQISTPYMSTNFQPDPSSGRGPATWSTLAGLKIHAFQGVFGPYLLGAQTQGSDFSVCYVHFRDNYNELSLINIGPVVISRGPQAAGTRNLPISKIKNNTIVLFLIGNSLGNLPIVNVFRKKCPRYVCTFFII